MIRVWWYDWNNSFLFSHSFILPHELQHLCAWQAQTCNSIFDYQWLYVWTQHWMCHITGCLILCRYLFITMSVLSSSLTQNTVLIHCFINLIIFLQRVIMIGNDKEEALVCVFALGLCCWFVSYRPLPYLLYEGIFIWGQGTCSFSHKPIHNKSSILMHRRCLINSSWKVKWIQEIKF